MLKSRRKLPPMTSLPAFEAAARTLSFTKAAQELCVTQAAISRQIASLEDNLGVKLFERSHRKIKLTPKGQHLQHNVTIALDLLESATLKTQIEPSNETLTIAADTSMAYRWLMPKIEEFHQKYPLIKIDILACDHEVDCLKPHVDLILLYGNGYWDNYDARLIFEEEIFPVCHPDYLKKHPIDNIQELTDHYLLDLKGERWDWVGWEQWLTELDVPTATPLQGMSFNSLPLLIDATLQGQGIGLGWGKLVDDLIKKESLHRLFDASLKTGRGYYVLKKANTRLSENTTAVYDWIINHRY